MTDRIVVTFTGSFAPDNRISARTLGHALSHLQRAIDKTVIHTRRGSLRKYSSLSSSDYGLAEFVVEPFMAGSIKIPLIGTGLEGISAKLRGVLEEPYGQLGNNRRQEEQRIADQVPAAYNSEPPRDSWRPVG